MFHKIRSQLPPFSLLASGLIVVTLLTSLSGLWHYQYVVSHSSVSPAVVSKYARHSLASKSDSATLAEAQTNLSQPSNAAGASVDNTGQTFHRSSGSASGSAVVSTPAAGGQPASVASGVSQSPYSKLALSVNGQARGSVELAAGSNQCDVLSQALADGLISNLKMRTSSGIGIAVYVIDDVGDPGSVWWTYTVNGRAPPYGCAGVTAHSGDSVNWQYVKP